MINRRHLIAATAALGMLVSASASMAADKGLIGISMPTKSSTRWISDGNSMVKDFTALGYSTDLQYAEDDIPNQLAQIENMVTKGAKVLVIAAIDGTTLSDVLAKAHTAGIKVFAYDRLIRGSANVDYYSTFDNFKVGVLQANSLLQGLGIDKGKTGPFNIELFGGSPDDNNAFFFYDGAMSVLQPLIDKKVLVVQSGQMGMKTVGTLRWDGAVAQARMDNLLSAFYGKKRVDAVLSPYDGLSRWHHLVAQRRRLWHQGPADADRLRPGCRASLGQGDHLGRAILDRLQGHPQPRQADGDDGGRCAQRQGSAGQ